MEIQDSSYIFFISIGLPCLKAALQNLCCKDGSCYVAFLPLRRRKLGPRSRKKEENVKIDILGCCAEQLGHYLESFLLDGRFLFDAGSLSHTLLKRAPSKIEKIFITHAHLDHLLGIPFLAENIFSESRRHRVDIISIPPVLRTIKNHLLNNRLWPDFTTIPNPDHGILSLVELKAGETVRMDGYAITPHKVNHTVPAVGYLVECESKRRFFYTGDTGPSDATWREIGNQRLHCLITEVSFPDRLEEFAIRTGHLTTRLLGRELLKMRNTPERIYITSSKPKYFGIIEAELEKLKINNLRLLRDGETIKV